MDDKKVFELKRLELAYKKQLLFMLGMIFMTFIGIILYILNVTSFNLQLFLVSVTLIVVGAIGIFSIDTHMKDISKNIRGL
ncbi:MAG: hypothetical protein ACP5OA_04255 [Candidatus Woesearchaeota archaeon]